MSTLSRAAREWLANRRIHNTTDATAVVVDLASGVAASRRTAVGHYVADCAEISLRGETTLAAEWLCGGSTVDGFMVEDATVDCVACRLAAALPSRPCVYYAWGEDDDLLYVGSTINAPQRIRAHSTQTHWWGEVRRLTFDEYDTEREVRVAEASAIYAEPGVYNRESRRRPGVANTDLLRLVEGDAAS